MNAGHLDSSPDLNNCYSYIVGKRCSLKSTDESNFINIVVFGLEAPLTATKCAVTLHRQHIG